MILILLYTLYIDENIIKETECMDSEISLSLKLEREFNKSIDIKFLNFSHLPFQYHASTNLLLFHRFERRYCLPGPSCFFIFPV